ncbi:MAG: hypothetical protein ACK5LC_02930 [Coprobacillaceae bacterium]
MILTFTNNEVSIDFKVAETERIIDVLKTISENTEMRVNLETVSYVYSKRLQEQIHILNTFESVEIYNGDILEIRG